ncbi:HIT family protein [Candidatus Nomurabacteria bacterium]|nr:HIT family protein [Candidatus Kaiserbacteria bacterium]MCB9814602.1 HIT family protein [Candidatus Nomurabacteria bacterium]
MTTIFSKIIAREIPADIIYEDDIVLVFLDIKPINLGHTLVIPKEPSIDGTETNPDTLAHMIKIAQKIALAQKSTLGCTGVNYIMNNGSDAGQEVFHTHLHVIPRFPNDGSFKHAVHCEFNPNEVPIVKDKLIESLNK